MPLANIIFPAFSAPYYSQLLFPIAGIAAILMEVLIFRKRYASLSVFKVVIFALTANIVSWIAGIGLSHFLPSGLVPKMVPAGDRDVSILTTGPNFGSLVALSFGTAFILSILIEYLIWKTLTFRTLLPNLFRTTCIAHIASYLVLILIGVIYFLNFR